MTLSTFFRPLGALLVLLPLTGAVPLALTSCQTPQAFPAPAANWQSDTGQMHYAGARSIVGDVVVRRSGVSDFQLAFSSGPGFPLLRVWESGDRARAEGAFARGSWQGSAARPPAPLAGWLRLREVFAAVPARGGKFSGQGWTAEATVSSGRLEHLVVSSTAGSERFTFHFSR